jgi:DNA-binding CsgD family transcriptional regulator
MFAGSNQIPRERYREIIDRDMPNAVNINISRRLASLSPLCIEMLKKAAVIGELFTLDELKLLDYSFQESSLDLFADEAVSADFVRYSREEKAYLFSHSVVHQTILLNVREDDVRRDRIKLAGAAENPDAIMTKKTALKLASWWSEGRGPDARGKYLYYLLAAGDRAFTEGLMEEAAEIYERGLGHLALPEENEITDREAEILVKIGKARFRTGSRISALPYFKKAFHYYKKQNDIERMADIAYQPGYLAAGDPGFYNFYNDVLDMLDCDSPLKARVLSAYGINLLVNKGEYRKARQILDSAYKTAENCGDILCMQRTLIGLSYIDYSFHRYDAVLSTFAKASLLLEKQPDIFTEWHIHAASTALVRARNSGEPGDIIKWVPLLEGIAGCAKGHPFIRLRAQLLLFLSAYLLKEPAMAREAFTQFNLKKDYRYNVIRPYLLERFKGLAEHTLGNHEKAVKYLQKALDSALFFGDRPLSAWIRFELTEAAEGLEAEPGLSGSGLRHSLALCRDDAFSLGMIGLVGKIDDLSKKYGLNSGNNGNSLEMHLSARETEILKLLEKGFSNNKIAETLGISFFTVVNHVRNILKKTGAANRTQAASWARNEMFLNKYPDITRREIV